MRKFKYEFETIKFPIIIMLIMFFIKGLSNTILSPLVLPMINQNFMWLISLMEIFQYFSTFVIQYLPFLIVMKYLSVKHSKTSIVLLFLVSYILLLTTTMKLGTRDLPSIAYQGLFGIGNKIASIDALRVNVQTPYRLGVIGAIIPGIIVHYSHKLTRSRTKYGFFRFIDRDILSLILTVIITLLIGVGFSYVWPIIINFIFNIFNWISKDINNPGNMLVYGFFDKTLSLLNLSELNRETFWFTAYGGTWMSPMAENFIGDVSIWNATTMNDIYNTGFGHFITPYYIINLFAIPGIIVGLFTLFTNKKERYTQIGLLIALLLMTIVSDLSLPIEVFLFIMAPLLFFIHVFFSMAIFAILQGVELFLGSSLIESVVNPSLGNGVEFYHNLLDPMLSSTVIKLMFIGIFIFVLYVLMTRIFYKRLAIGLINKFDIEHQIQEFLGIVGGIENVESIHSTPFRVEVKLKRPQAFNYDLLAKTNIKRVIETRSVYAIYYGTSSTMIRNEILVMQEILENED